MKTIKFQIQSIYQEEFKSILGELALEGTLVSSKNDVSIIEVNYFSPQKPVIETIKILLESEFVSKMGYNLVMAVCKLIDDDGKYVLVEKAHLRGLEAVYSVVVEREALKAELRNKN